MDLDRLLKDADSARKLNPCKADVAGFRMNPTVGSHNPAPTSAIASRIGLLGGFLLLFLGSMGSAGDDEDNGNVLSDLDDFRAGDYDLSKPTAEQCVVSPHLRLGSWMG